MSDNPYQVPAAELERPAVLDENQMHEPRGVNSGRGGRWFTEGWQLFVKKPVTLTIIAVLMFVIFMVGGLIPVVGGLLTMLFWPHFSAGFFLACRHAREGQPVRVGDLFTPFNNLGNLLVLGALYMAASIGLILIAVLLMFGSMGAAGVFDVFLNGDLDSAAMDAGAMVTGILLALLVMMALAIPFTMAFLFAPVLVYQHGLQAMDAIRQSFRGCLRNMGPFLIWGLVWLAVIIAMAVLAVIPVVGMLIFMLFMLIVIPVSISNLYVAYEDIYLR